MVSTGELARVNCASAPLRRKLRFLGSAAAQATPPPTASTSLLGWLVHLLRHKEQCQWKVLRGEGALCAATDMRLVLQAGRATNNPFIIKLGRIHY